MNPIKNHLFSITKKSLDWLFPDYCLVCEQMTKANQTCCDHCLPKLPYRQGSCRQCGQRLADGLDYCGQCLTKPSSYDACFCAFEYDEPVQTWIRQLKYGQQLRLAKQLGHLLARELIDQAVARPELIICVPMHWQKRLWRGFNQSSLLAKEVSRLLNIPYSSTHIVKSRKTPPQAGLKLAQRLHNVKNSMAIKNQINASHVAIIDDVITTGSTVQEMTKILKKNGVDYVQVWGVAHTN